MYQQVAPTEISFKKVYSKNVFDTLNIIYVSFYLFTTQKRKKTREETKQNQFVNRFLCEDIIITFTCIKNEIKK